MFYFRKIQDEVLNLNKHEHRKEKPTFLETVKHILATPFENANVHFKSVTYLCTPCEISYDVVGKQETFEEDSDYIIKKKHLGQKLHTGIRLNPSLPMFKNLTYSNLFSQIPPDLIEALKVKYLEDFLLFGYSLDGIRPVSNDLTFQTILSCKFSEFSIPIF